MIEMDGTGSAGYIHTTASVKALVSFNSFSVACSRVAKWRL